MRLLLIVFGIHSAYQDSDHLAVAKLSAASDVITEFIGAVFLVIYRSTMAQAGAYFGALERMNAVGMAVQIVDLSPTASVELKSQAQVELAKQILATGATKPKRSGTTALHLPRS